MALFKKLFKKDETKLPRGFSMRRIKQIDRLTGDTIKITFDWSEAFTPGQYVNVAVTVGGSEQRRSYSICSPQGGDIAIAIKEVADGYVSKWFNNEAREGMEIAVSSPEGNFVLPEGSRHCVAIAAGSGITPIMAIGHQMEAGDGSLRLFFGNRTEADILFRQEIDGLKNTTPYYFLSQEQKDGFESGRITKEAFSDVIKRDLSILKSDVFMLCGPEEMIHAMTEVLDMFGVSKEKIRFELFTTPTQTENTGDSDTSVWEGTSKVTIIIDGDEEVVTLNSKKTILDAALDEGMDAPYSCRGGVCSTCKAKVTEGSARLAINYSLTDSELAEGYILTCQAHPTSETITVNYDEA